MNKEEIERIDDQGMAAWDAHDGQAFAALFADEFVLQDWTSPEPIRNDKAAVAGYLDAWIQAFPDMRVKTASRVIGEDSVAAEIEFTATNSGTMRMGGMEMAPTNRQVTGRGAYMAWIRDGKIVEFHAFPDAAGMLMQLGLMPQR